MALRRQNARLDSFLKRALAADDYDRLRCYESVIVVSADENKAFKYVVLGHRTLYLSENPPKTLRATLELRDVEDIALVQDFPSFLSGTERDNTQHIQIKYRQSISTSPSNSSSRALKKSPQSVTQRPGHISLSSKDSNDFLARKLNQLHLSPTGSPIRSPRPLPHVENGSKSGRRLSDSPDSHSTRSSISPGESPSCSPRSLPVRNGIDTPRTHHLSNIISSVEMKDTVNRKNGPKRSMSTPVFSEEMDHKGKTSGANTPMMLTPGSSPSRCRQAKLSVNDEFAASSFTPSVTKSASISSSSASDELYGVRVEGRSTTIEKSLSAFSHSASLDALHQMASSPSIVSKARLLSDNLLSLKGSGELHLYILSRESPFFMNLQAAVLNYNIEATLHYLSNPALQRSPIRNEIGTAVLYHQMIHELLTATSIEQRFQLVQELKVSCDKVYSLKRHFWKTPELLEFLVQQLENNVCSLSQASDECKQADELEYAVVVLQAVTSMFRETEVLDCRVAVLMNKKDPVVSNLVALLLKYTEPKVTNPQSNKRIKERPQNGEICQLVDEVSDCVISLLFELFLAVQQTAWLSDISSGFNICWMTSCIEGSQNANSVVDCLMKRTTHTLGAVYLKAVFPGGQAVLLYQQLYIIKTILQYTQKVASYMKETYAEEFRYYFQDPAIGRWLPVEYPLTAPTLKLVSEILARTFHNSSFRPTSSTHTIGNH